MSYAFSGVVMYQSLMRAAPPLISGSSDPSADSSYIKNSNQSMISNTLVTNHSSTAVTCEVP